MQRLFSNGMKRSELFFNFLLVPIDIIMIVGAFALAYFWRLKSGDIIYIWPFAQYFKFVLSVAPIWILLFALEGLYDTKRNKKATEEFTRVFLGVSLGIMVVMAWIFLTRTFFFSRLVVLYAFLIALALVFLARVIIRAIERYLFRYGVGVHRVIIIGNNRSAKILFNEITNDLGLGYKITGLIQTRRRSKDREIQGLEIFGAFKDFREIIKEKKPDDVILADPLFSAQQTVKLLEFCEDERINFKSMPSLFEVHSTNVNVNSIAGIPIIEFKDTPLEGWGQIIKRIVDIIGSAIGLIILSPIFLITSILIKFDSSGPVFFRQKRVGPDGNFIFYKFRTMKAGAEKEHAALIKKYGNMFKLKKDPRITRLGRFLRRTSIDELPQLWNVLRGEMSLVGPRPPMLIETRYYSRWQRKRLKIKPGITGLWQISGRSNVSFDEWVRMDVYYIEHWSLWLDLQILLKTFGAVLKKTGAY